MCRGTEGRSGLYHHEKCTGLHREQHTCDHAERAAGYYALTQVKSDSGKPLLLAQLVGDAESE